MPEIYADWKSLKPLTAPVPVGTKCVVIGNTNCHGFKKGQIVTRSDAAESGNNTDVYSDANDYWWIKLSELALLPADYQAEPQEEPTAEQKPERKIVQIATLLDGIVCLCNDGTVLTRFPSDNKWHKLPPIPQD